jgi:hypothetical protein
LNCEIDDSLPANTGQAGWRILRQNRVSGFLFPIKSRNPIHIIVRNTEARDAVGVVPALEQGSAGETKVLSVRLVGAPVA